MTPRENRHGQPVGDAVVGWSPRPRPDPGPFEGRTCSVVPLRGDHAPELYATCAAPGTERLWTYLNDGPFPDRDDFAAWVARTAQDPSSVSVAILDGSGSAQGLASYLRIDRAHGSVEVGGILLGLSLRRTTAATEAMYLMARHVFEDLGYRRYEWKCDALNAASCAAARRLGFRFEGVHRQALVTKGRNRDTAWFSVTDGDWPRVRRRLEAWLVPANFGPDGSQRSSLGAVAVDR